MKEGYIKILTLLLSTTLSIIATLLMKAIFFE